MYHNPKILNYGVRNLFKCRNKPARLNVVALWTIFLDLKIHSEYENDEKKPIYIICKHKGLLCDNCPSVKWKPPINFERKLSPNGYKYEYKIRKSNFSFYTIWNKFKSNKNYNKVVFKIYRSKIAQLQQKPYTHCMSNDSRMATASTNKLIISQQIPPIIYNVDSWRKNKKP